MKKDDIFDFENPQDDSNDIYSSSARDTLEDIYSSSDSAEGEHYYRANKDDKKGKKSKKSKKRRRRIAALLITLTSLLLVLAIMIGVVLKTFEYDYNNIEATNSELGFNEIINKKIINIALFGVDTRDTDSLTGNTDSIMILSLNTQTKKIKLISILRDSLVEIDYNGKKSYKKINSAYAKGGPELAIKTINQNFNLDISEYATVNFFGMADIIDAVGGIEVELTRAEVQPVSSGVKALNETIRGICVELGLNPSDYYVTEAGKQHLNGIQAVGYSRIRYVSNIWGTNNDQGRTDRQRYVMEQLFASVKGLAKNQYLTLIKALLPYVETSLSVDQIFSIAVKIMLNSPSFEQSRVPLDEYQMPATHSLPSVGSYVYYDRDYAADVLHAFIYDDIEPEAYMEQYGILKNDWYAKIS